MSGVQRRRYMINASRMTCAKPGFHNHCPDKERRGELYSQTLPPKIDVGTTTNLKINLYLAVLYNGTLVAKNQ